MVDISASQMDSRSFALALLAESNVAVAPGSAFGPVADDHVRICFAPSEEAISTGVERLAAFLSKSASTPTSQTLTSTTVGG
jgi:aspartate/methionine/tyrosine aminotransferase